jgi:nucleoside-diphosphate-sugar epimerase
LPSGLDFVFFAAAPDDFGDEEYQAIYVHGLGHLLDALQNQNQHVKRVYFTSSTAVYAQSEGEWVDEGTSTEPAHFSGIRMLEAEHVLLQGPFPATVLRLGGVYGPGRGRLIERVRQGNAVCAEGPPMYTNRIHRDDCAGALRHLMMLAKPNQLYIGVDHEPAGENEVIRWLAAHLDLPPPRVVKSPEASQHRLRGNKRCRNTKLVGSGYVFQYPTFREGYGAMLTGAGAQGRG